MQPFRCSLVCAQFLFAVGLGFAQTSTFEVHVEGHPAVTFGAADLATFTQHTIQVNEHGKNISYSGVLVYDVLAKAGAPLGEKLRGKALSNYVLATARDGYAVVYALPEFDPAFTDAQPLIASKADGQVLPESQGPWRMVMPQDKKPSRSLRMLERIDIVQLAK